MLTSRLRDVAHRAFRCIVLGRDVRGCGMNRKLDFVTVVQIRAPGHIASLKPLILNSKTRGVGQRRLRTVPGAAPGSGIWDALGFEKNWPVSNKNNMGALIVPEPVFFRISGTRIRLESVEELQDW